MREITAIDLGRLADYFAKELPPNEVASVEDWLAEHPGREQVVQRLEQSRLDLNALENRSDLTVRADVESIIAKLEQDVAMQRTATVEANARVKKRSTALAVLDGFSSVAPRPMWYAAIGGALCVLAAIGGLQFGAKRAVTGKPNTVSTYATNNGERATVTLPDGSVVLLNVASRIQVPTNYSPENRTLYLSGEALFTVIHKAGAPFTVVAGPSTTRVLGTSFLVRHYSTDSVATIAVRDGKVAVDSTVLTASQQVTVGWKITRPRVTPADTTQFSFASDVLTLNRTTLREAIPRLNRWYNADIRLSDPQFETRRISSEFAAGSLADLTTVLDATFDDIGVVRNGRILTLYWR